MYTPRCGYEGEKKKRKYRVIGGDAGTFGYTVISQATLRKNAPRGGTEYNGVESMVVPLARTPPRRVPLVTRLVPSEQGSQRTPYMIQQMADIDAYLKKKIG